MKHLKYTYTTLFWIGLLITLFGFIHFVITFNFVITLFGFGFLLGTQEFYETYNISNLDENN